MAACWKTPHKAHQFTASTSWNILRRTKPG